MWTHLASCWFYVKNVHISSTVDENLVLKSKKRIFQEKDKLNHDQVII